MLVLERRDENRNMARFYVLAIEPILFGDSALVREWDGLAPGVGDSSIFTPMPRHQARLLKAWLQRKERRGYRRTV